MDGYIRRMSGFLQGAKDVILNNTDISVTSTGEALSIRCQFMNNVSFVSFQVSTTK